MTKLNVPMVLPIVKEFCKKHLAGGTLHIVLSDQNIDDSNLEFCMEYAIKNDDMEGYAIACILYAMSRTQRLKITNLCWSSND